MKPTYFETLHREEVRHAEARMLDNALQARQSGHSWLRRYRCMLGHTLIGLGTRLVGAQEICANSTMHSCD